MADEKGSTADGTSMQRRLQPALIGAIVLGLALLAFILQNTEETDVKWLFFEFDFPLWLLLVITSALAIAGGELAGYFIRRARRKD